MPDGAMPIDQLLCDLPFARMYGRLVDYGLCFVRGTGMEERRAHADIIATSDGDRIVLTKYADPDPNRKPRVWSQPEINAAGRLHSAIIALPLAHSLCLQVFFSETCAEEWADLTEGQRLKMARDLTLWPAKPYGLNARISRANVARGTNAQPIHWTRFIGLRDDAIRMLINRRA